MAPRLTVLTLIFSLIASTALNAAKSAHAPESELIHFKQLASSGKVQEAYDGVSLLVPKYPDDLQVKLLYAALVGDIGNLEHSAALFDELVKSYPDLPDPVTGLAMAQARQGRLLDAYKTLLSGVKTFPDNGLLHENLAEVYTIFATMEYQKVLAMGQGSERVKAKLKHLGMALSDRQQPDDVEWPAVAEVDVKRPAVVRADVKQPAVARAKVERPVVARAEVKQPAVARAEIKQPAVARAEIKRPVVAEADFRAAPTAVGDSGTCRAVGPFRGDAELKRASAWLSVQNISASKVMYRLREVTHLVYLPPEDSYVAAKALREKLTQQGIKDTAIITSGSLKYAVSLGVYRQVESAQRRVKQLARNNYKAESAKRNLARTRAWLRFGKAAVISNAELLAGVPGHNLQVRKTTCS
jgi:tetratricopeptide (TPR) repeat protein